MSTYGGPYHEYNICNVKYVLSLVEDHSRVVWTYLLQSKDHVYGVLVGIIQMVDTHFHKKIQYFCSDHGSEFLNKTVAQMFKDHGILHQLSCIYTP